MQLKHLVQKVKTKFGDFGGMHDVAYVEDSSNKVVQGKRL